MAINLSETECEVAGLRFALEAMLSTGEAAYPAHTHVSRSKARIWCSSNGVADFVHFRCFCGLTAEWSIQEVLTMLRENGHLAWAAKGKRR